MREAFEIAFSAIDWKIKPKLWLSFVRRIASNYNEIEKINAIELATLELFWTIVYFVFHVTDIFQTIFL